MSNQASWSSLKRSRSDSASTSPARKRSQSVEMRTENDVDMLNPPYETVQPLEGQQTQVKPLPEKQHEDIIRLKGQPLQLNDTWYIVSRTWYKRWDTACAPVETRDAKDLDALSLSVDQVGPIDNSPLLGSSGQLEIAPQEGVNAEFLPREAWLLLESWYGLKDPPGAIERRVISYGSQDSLRIEYFPPLIRFRRIVNPHQAHLFTDLAEPAPIVQFSVAQTLAELRERARLLYNLPEDAQIRFFRLPTDTDVADPNCVDPSPLATRSNKVLAHIIDPSKHELAGDQSDNVTLAEASLDESFLELGVDTLDSLGNFAVTVDTPPATETAPERLSIAPISFANKGFFDDTSKFPKTTGAVNQLTARNKSNSLFATRTSHPPVRVKERDRFSPATRSTPKLEGLTGLQNLGNTCFMNSALQCLSNALELRKYFESPAWRKEINKDNPLGMSGAVAEAFGDLIQQIWSPKTGNSVAPRNFKTMIGRFRPMFIGWSQQDSQEFISFLLDGLHEDLNRILKKPATVKPEWEGGGDKEMWTMAVNSWNMFKLRNDSVIVDLFQGMYRSTVICPDCGKVSITFDPFTSLTLPLPPKKWQGVVWVVPADPNRPRYRLVLSAPTSTSIADLKVLVGQKTDLDPKTLFSVDIFKDYMYKSIPDSGDVTDITADPKSSSPRDVVHFFELPFQYLQLASDYRRKSEASDAVMDGKAGRVVVPVTFRSKKQGFGSPFLIGFQSSAVTSHDALYNALVRQVARYSKKGSEMFEEEEATDANGAAPNGASASNGAPSSRPKIPENAEAVPNLFKIYVNSLAGRRDNIPIGGQHNQSKTDVLLQERIKGPSSLAPSPSRFPGSYDNKGFEDDEEELKTRYADVQDESVPPEPQPETPVIRTGDSITLEFPEPVYNTFFGPENELFSLNHAEEIDELEEASGSPARLDLESCLNEFSKTEHLDSQNTWYCPACKDHKEATKQVDLWSLPDVLVIHLKRFSASRYGTRDKISDLVHFPLEGLDLTPRVIERKVAQQLSQSESDVRVLGDYKIDSEPLVYDLFAVDNHFGGLGGGHYTAFAKNAEDGRWYNFDDSHVSPTSPNSVQTSAAYLLFYRRRTSRPFGGKTREIVQLALEAEPSPTDSELKSSSSGSSLLPDDPEDRHMPDDLEAAKLVIHRSNPPSTDTDLSAVSSEQEDSDCPSDQAMPDLDDQTMMDSDWDSWAIDADDPQPTRPSYGPLHSHCFGQASRLAKDGYGGALFQTGRHGVSHRSLQDDSDDLPDLLESDQPPPPGPPPMYYDSRD